MWNIESCIACHDGNMLQRMAHVLLTSFQSLGAPEAEAIAEKLEELGLLEDFRKAEAEYAGLQREIDRVKQEIAARQAAVAE